MKRQNRQFTKLISLLKFSGLLVVTVGFTTKVDHQTTSKIWSYQKVINSECLEFSDNHGQRGLAGYDSLGSTRAAKKKKFHAGGGDLEKYFSTCRSPQPE